MIEIVFAALIVTACAVLLVRLVLGERRRWRFDAAVSTAARAAQARIRAIWNWRASRAGAARAAEEALRRAREGVHRDGNVIRPKSFRSPRKPH